MNRRLRLRREEDGFSLVEIMVVIVVIAILLAIAIPTFFGARDKANNRSAQSNIRNGYTAERIYYAEAQQFTDDVPTLKGIEAALNFVTTNNPGVWQTGSVYVYVAADKTLTVAALSATSKCYYLREANPSAGAMFATDTGCRALNDPLVVFGSATWSS